MRLRTCVIILKILLILNGMNKYESFLTKSNKTIDPNSKAILSCDLSVDFLQPGIFHSVISNKGKTINRKIGQTLCLTRHNAPLSAPPRRPRPRHGSIRSPAPVCSLLVRLHLPVSTEPIDSEQTLSWISSYLDGHAL